MDLKCEKCLGEIQSKKDIFQCIECGNIIGEDIDIPEEMF